MRFGAHVATMGSLASVPARARAMGADCVQIFVTNPRGWRTTRPSDNQIDAFRDACAKAGIDAFIHVMYLVNYASPDRALRERSVAALRHAMALADDLGVAGVVTHLGSHRQPGNRAAGFDAALDHLCEGLAAGLADSRSALLAENSAGAGGSIGDTVEELARIVDRLGTPERLGICLDTAHLLAAGHEIRTRAGLDRLVRDFDGAIGRGRLQLLHLNDSKCELGSRRDRHENIGDGHIGVDGFTQIVNHPALAALPGVLEVPGLAGNGPDEANLSRLRSLVR